MIVLPGRVCHKKFGRLRRAAKNGLSAELLESLAVARTTLSPRDLPSVDRLLRDPLLEALPRDLALQAARDVLDEARRATRDGGWTFRLEDLPRLVEERVREASQPPLR